MKRFVISFILAVMLIPILYSGAVGEHRRDQQEAGRVALINVEEAVESETVQAIAAFVRQQLGIVVDIVALREFPGSASSEITKAVCNQFQRTYRIIVIFKNTEDAGPIYIDQNSGVSHINPCRLNFEPIDQLGRRLERLTMRSIGRILGLPDDPDPRCVMHPYESIEDLDRMGRNFSPPWKAKFDQAAEAAGLERLPD